MMASGAAVLAMAAPASAAMSDVREIDAHRGMHGLCRVMMQDRPGMEQVRESMMRNPAMQRMCEMMMQGRPEMAAKCKAMMDEASAQV